MKKYNVGTTVPRSEWDRDYRGRFRRNYLNTVVWILLFVVCAQFLGMAVMLKETVSMRQEMAIRERQLMDKNQRFEKMAVDRFGKMIADNAKDNLDTYQTLLRGMDVAVELTENARQTLQDIRNEK